MATAAGKKAASAPKSAANGSISETALKLKHVKGIHEDDGREGEAAASDALPLDAQVLGVLLESMGADKHEPRVVNQLQEFVHRYVTDILIDAHEYATYAAKQAIDADDVRLAIASRLNHHYANAPSRELMMELAEKRNAIPLPPISNEYGVRLPPMQHQLVTYESERHHDDALLTQDEASADDEPMPLQRLEGSRNKKIARQQIAIHLNQRDEWIASGRGWTAGGAGHMWAFDASGYDASNAGCKPAKTFTVEDFLSSLFRPEDAFVHAASLNQLEVVRRWISRHHDVNAPDKEGHLALCCAAQNRCMEVMALLLESGVDVNRCQADGKSALHVACTWGRHDAAALLLLHRANPSVRDKSGQVPLHGACRNGHDRIVQLLLDAEIDPFVVDDCGITPFDLCRDWQRPDILRVLDDYHHTRFAATMRHRVRYAMSHLPPQMPSLPTSMQTLVWSFLC